MQRLTILLLLGVSLGIPPTDTSGQSEDKKKVRVEVETPLFVEEGQYFELGLAAFKKYLSSRGEAYERLTEKAYLASVPSVVKLHVQLQEQVQAAPSAPLTISRSIGAASGVLVNGGRHLLTAGHSFHELPPSTKITAYLPDGREFQCRVERQKYSPEEDWAILSVISPPSDPLPSLAVAEGPEVTECLFLGYPNGHFLVKDHVLPDPGGSFKGQPLPLLLRSKLSGAKAWEGLAGAAPEPGFSGAPGIDVATSSVVAIVTGVQGPTWTLKEGEAPTISEGSKVLVTPIRSYRRALEELSIPFKPRK